MTIRAELELLGPEAVRAGMLAFEHRGESGGPRDGWLACKQVGGVCCFIAHAVGPHANARQQCDAHEALKRIAPGVEVNFENYSSFAGYLGGREVLRQECIAFLAEHGSAIEAGPVETAAVR